MPLRLVPCLMFAIGAGIVTIGCSSANDQPSSPRVDAAAGIESDAQSSADVVNEAGTAGNAQDASDGAPSPPVADGGYAGELGPWVQTADYALGADDCAGTAPNLYCAAQTCVAASGYVYCVGGLSTSTYYSQLSSTGLGTWSPATDYPEPIEDESCGVSSNYIYCVGGRVGGADGGATGVTADVYFAPLLSPGIGAWTASTPYPHAADGARCMVDAGHIYCVSNAPDSLAPDAYFATLSSTGVGAWAPTNAPPGGQGCAAIGGYAYCFGGGGCEPPSDCYSQTYFAPLGASGIGTWNTTTELPTAVSATYASAGSTIYWLSTPVFFANVSAGGVGPWQTTTNYPQSLYPQACFSSDGYLYCANPVAGGSYFAQIGVFNPQALQLASPLPFPRADYLVPACTSGGVASVNGVGAPTFGKDIDEAVVFDCLSQASTDAGCTTTVKSSVASFGLVSDCNYQTTVWYPCPSSTPADTNCCFQPAVGYNAPLYGWCASVGSNSFIITTEIALQQPDTNMAGDDGGLP